MRNFFVDRVREEQLGRIIEREISDERLRLGHSLERRDGGERRAAKSSLPAN